MSATSETYREFDFFAKSIIFAYKPSNFANSISRHFTIFSGPFFVKITHYQNQPKRSKWVQLRKKSRIWLFFREIEIFWKPSYLSLNYACKVSLWWFIRIRNNVLCYASEIRVLQRLRDSKNKHCVQVCFSSIWLTFDIKGKLGRWRFMSKPCTSRKQLS